MTRPRFLAVIAITAVFATPALALDPPARFDHTPTTPVVVIATTTESVCPERNAYGCAYPGWPSGVCTVYVNARLGPAERAAVLRHEFAHCAGWPADHPP